MEVKKPTIKSIPYEDFKDNEYLENMVKQLNEGGTKVQTAKRRKKRKLWRGRANS